MLLVAEYEYCDVISNRFGQAVGTSVPYKEEIVNVENR